MRRYLAPLTVAVALCTAAVAHADEAPAATTDSSTPSAGGSAFKQAGALLDASPQTRSMQLSFFAGIPWGSYFYCGAYGGCGFPLELGARFNIPVVPNGFVPMLNDSFDIEFGADFDLYFGGLVGFGIIPVVSARYTFYLLPNLWVYPKLEFGVGIIGYPGYAVFPRFHWNFLAGVGYNITQKISLRAEVGYYALKVGIGINF